jgi:uncharacterized protein with ParB-like and HNH nuclease domain
MPQITPYYKSIRDLLQGRSFSIDEYQREYKWDEKNIVELVSDLLEKFKSCYQPGHAPSQVSNYEGYFLGSIIVTNRGGVSFLIDGQQRVTSLTLLLIHLYRESRRLNNELGDMLKPLIFSDNYGRQVFNLDITERLPVIDALYSGVDFNPEGLDESMQTMYKRYADIERQEIAGELDEAFPHFIYWLLNKVGLIEISTDNDNYAYSIFETMNDRGKPLSPVDMLKAYLLAPIEDSDSRRAANQVWKNEILSIISWGGDYDPKRDFSFIQAWLRSQYAQSIRPRAAGATDQDWELIGSVFHRWARDNCQRLGWGTEQTNLQLINRNLTFYSRAYRLILDAGKVYTPGLKSVFYLANVEFTWAPTVLLAALTTEDSDEVVKQKIETVATYLDIWLFRRIANYVRMGYNAANYPMFQLIQDIRGKNLAELRTILSNKLSNDEFGFDGHEGRGTQGISDFKLNQYSRRYIYHMLARMTSFVEFNSGRPDLFDRYVDRQEKNSMDIEHIWADDYNPYRVEFQSPEEFQEARNNLAGLLLLPADVNRSYQDRPFSEKAPYYAQQNLLAASLTPEAYRHQPQFLVFIERSHLPFESYTIFGRAEQLRRKNLTAELVNMIWSDRRLSLDTDINLGSLSSI